MTKSQKLRMIECSTYYEEGDVLNEKLSKMPTMQLWL